MSAYLFKRLLQIIPTLLGITLITFLIIQLAPGNPAVLKLQMASQGQIGDSALSQQIIEQTKKLYGLDKPLPVQYLLWVKRVFTLDFGTSYKDHRRVWDKIAERLPITIQLNVISIFLVYLIAIPCGIYSATRSGSFSDRLLTLFFFFLYSLPSFWVAVLLIMLFGGGDFWDIFPVYGISSIGAETLPFAQWLADRLWHLILPVICLTYGGLAYLSRLTRADMLEVIREDYIRTARAKGLSERVVIFKHAFRNALLPIITLLAFLLPSMFGGSVIIESIFSIPGMGQLGFEAVLSRDYPVIMAITTLSAFLTLIGLLISDILYATLDPRIKLE
ncbi:ABC transporter permease [Desulforhabdus amnigena]|jgi:peptide/nickel transport system permease protein|uniref:Peptide ABC transporter permease n=1 Tax=Desulforhabdus amnigena TaxID=40218 RepID=A0A9W6CZF2_9BACT|nr:ABC transporter permease [Desulforhabdus amnigena]NLJ28870.1 ABC transporter permease [Deltaproteobacteria bacterium]GLI33112.1 peptide ABC transporter permease [Desulforhabdus amnigena]